MVDKSIGELVAASQINDTDLFVLEQSGEAKKLLGNLLKQYINRNVMSVSVSALPPDSEPTVSYDPNTGTLELGIPRGEKGESGESSAGYVSGIVKGNGAGGVSAAVAGTDYSVGASNRNLLDNPWFTVNQRGITSFQVGAYGVDRWVCSFLSPNCSIEVTENGIHFTNAAGPAQNCVLDQFIEKSRIPAETQVTLSVLYADGTVENDSGLPNQGIFVPNSRLGQASLAPLEDTYRLRLWQSNVGENTVRAVKLELGSVSTLANDTAPNYAEELAKCQRYYFEINQIVYFPATSQTDGSAEVFIPTPVTMRTVPSVSYTDLLSIGLRQGAAIGSPSSISPIACVPNGICLNLIADYIQRSGAPMTFYPTTGAHLAFSADL